MSPAGVVVEVARADRSKRLFGLKTVMLAFEYGAFTGVVVGCVGGFVLAKTYHSNDLTGVEKTNKIAKLAVLSVGGLALFAGAIKLLTTIKIKG